MPEEIVNGYLMHYEVHGDGQPLVMIHGGLGGGEGSLAMVDHQAENFSGDYRFIAYDRRAAGKSETPADGYDLPNQVQDLRALLERLDVSHAHVLGSSAGGPIAMRFALDYPEMVDSLLLINTMSYASHDERRARQNELDNLLANEAALGRTGAVEKALEARQPALRHDDPAQFSKLSQINLDRFDGIIMSIKAYLDIGDSIESRLAEIAMPTMIVHGDADTTIPVGCGIHLHELIPHSEFHIFPGALHGLMSNEPRRMGNMITEFLEEIIVKQS
jgi:pimeloyl-ACP methyl ester carboxylesterase